MRHLTIIGLMVGIIGIIQPEKLSAESAEVNPLSLEEGCALGEEWSELQGEAVVFGDVCLIKFKEDSENTTLLYHPTELAEKSPILLSISESPTYSGLRLAFIPNRGKGDFPRSMVSINSEVFAWHEGLEKARKIDNVSFAEMGIGVKYATFADIELLKALASADETAYFQFGWDAIEITEETKISINEILKVWESEYQSGLIRY